MLVCDFSVFNCTLRLLLSTPNPLELHNSRREGSNLQKNKQEDLRLRDSTCFIRREAEGGKAHYETVRWDSRRFRRIPDLPRMQGGKSVSFGFVSEWLDMLRKPTVMLQQALFEMKNKSPTGAGSWWSSSGMFPAFVPLLSLCLMYN